MKQDIATSPAFTADSAGGDWPLPDLDTPFADGPGRSENDFSAYCRLVTAVCDIASAYGWSRSEMAKRIGMPAGTFSQWAAKKYDGRYDTCNAKVELWLDTVADVRAMEALIPSPPPYLRLDMSKQMMELFTASQIMPAMTLVTAAAGMGKTMACRQYQRTHANVHISTMEPMTASYTAMLARIAEDIGISQPVRGQSLVSQIGRKIARVPGGTLLIIDECQHLNDQAVNQLRVFFDKYDCGIALVGNQETYSRYSESWMASSKYGQLHRRIFMRFNAERPPLKDIQSLIAAWGVTEPRSVEFLTGLALKPGALGQLNQTMTQALMVAGGDVRALTCRHLEKAHENRRVGGLK